MCLFSTNPALYSTCMYDKIHLICYVIVLHFLSFYLFFIFLFCFINTQNCLLKNVSFGYTLYRTVHRNFVDVIFNIVKQKELYEEHVQNSYSDRKGSNKVYQGSYKKTCYLQLSLGGDNQKYNPHKNTTAGGPLSSMKWIGT